jgi:trans-aconitate methyltransferase
MTAHIELLVLGVLLLLCLSLLVTQARTGVPTISANRAETYDIVALLRTAGIPESATIYELGSGWGTIALALAQAFPRATIKGIELSPFPFFVSRLRAMRHKNVHFMRGNFYKFDLSDADAVACYLMMKPMPKLASFLDKSLAPDTPVVALTFRFRDRHVTMTRNTAGLRGAAALYCWHAKK